MSSAKKVNGMVDVGSKKVTKRRSIAKAEISMSKKAYQALTTGGSPKGDVFEVARVAGVMAAKSTPQIIPLCHPLEINKVSITFKKVAKEFKVIVQAEVHSKGRTGVEMEALTAASAAVLTIYDMMKWADQTMVISDVKLLHKSGGKSGTYNRKK